MNPLLQSISHMDATLDSLLSYRPESVVTIEDDGDVIHISIGDDGLTVNEEEANAIVDKLGAVLMDREVR